MTDRTYDTYLVGTSGDDHGSISGTDLLKPFATDNLHVRGLAGDDNITTGSGDDFINGGRGNDLITTGTGKDIVWFGTAGSGNDTIAYFDVENDKIDLTAFKMTWQDVQNAWKVDAQGNVTISMTDPNDSTNISSVTFVNVDVIGSQIHVSQFSESNFIGLKKSPPDKTIGDKDAVDNQLIQGSKGNDTITGGAGHDKLSGRKGNDIIDGGAGDDRIAGGKGDDTMTGGDGADTYWFGTAGAGHDVITDFDVMSDRIDVRDFLIDWPTLRDAITTNDEGNTVINLSVLADSAKHSTITLEGLSGANLDVSNFVGLKHRHSDTAPINYLGTENDDDLTSGNGNDTIKGKGGDDNITTWNGDDVVDGGDGDDDIMLAGGNDTITGGAGSDTFTFLKTLGGGVKTITDFTVGEDLLDFSNHHNPEMLQRDYQASVNDLAARIVAGTADNDDGDATITLQGVPGNDNSGNIVVTLEGVSTADLPGDGTEFLL